MRRCGLAWTFSTSGRSALLDFGRGGRRGDSGGTLAWTFSASARSQLVDFGRGANPS